jgi:hypothetical protein
MDLRPFTYTGAVTLQCCRDCAAAMGDTEHGGRRDIGAFVSLQAETGALQVTTPVTEAKHNGGHPEGHSAKGPRGLVGLVLQAFR